MDRQLTGRWRLIVAVLATGLTLFHLVTSLVGTLPHIQQRALHFFVACAIILLTKQFLKKDTRETRPAIYDIALILLLLAAIVNVWFRYEAYLTYLVPLGLEGTIFALIVLIAILMAAYRTTGLTFPIMIFILLIYTQLGPYVPGMFAHQGISWSRVLATIYQQDGGAWGFLTGISATIVCIFLIFGALLRVTGGGESFVKIAFLIAGRRSGGPALVAVIASALFGMISGSATANVAAIGVYTIPMMKKVGYRPEFAGAVEAFSSTGGQFTPPILAATAFVMAEILGVSYITVVVLSIIPSFLYYTSAFFHILGEAKKMDLKPLPEAEIPKARELINWPTLGPLLVPIAVLLYLLATGWSVGFSGFWASFAAIVLRIFSTTRLSVMKKEAIGIIKAFEDAGRSVAYIAVVLVSAQIVVTLINVTGLGVNISNLIMAAGTTNVLMGIALTAVVVLLMGMGMPTTGAYVVGVSVAGSALIQMGLAPYGVHFMILYYAALSSITPPVCLSNFVAESISGASFWSISKIACGRLAFIAYILPFLFFFNSDLLIIGRNPLNVVVSTALAVLGIGSMSLATSGYWPYGRGRKLNPFFRLLACTGLLLLLPGWQVRIIGLAIGAALVVAMFLWDAREARRLAVQVRG